MPDTPYPVDPALTAIAIAYFNQQYIADLVCPRIRVGKQKFSFMQYSAETYFGMEDTLVGRRSRPNQVTMEGTEVTDSTDDHALDGGVPKADMDNADARYNPMANQITLLQELIAIRREARVAGVIFSAATYDPGLRETLGGTSQFSHLSSDPVGVVSDALDKPLIRPNQMVFGQGGWTKFRRHPAIVSAVLGNEGRSGLVTRQQVADLFEVNEVIVGQSRGNTAKPGQVANLSRLWGNHLALTYKAPVVDREVATFAATFQWGDRFAPPPWEDKNMGARGGMACRTGESVKERVVAKQAGYFFENAFAA